MKLPFGEYVSYCDFSTTKEVKSKCTNPTTNQPNGQAEQIERTTNQEVLTSEVQMDQMGIAWFGSSSRWM